MEKILCNAFVDETIADKHDKNALYGGLMYKKT